MAAAFLTAATAQDLVRSAEEHRVVGALSGDQVYPALSLGPSGGYLIWQDSVVDKVGEGVAAVRVDASGQPLGNPFLVTQKTRGHQQHPRVASLSNGGAVMVWQSGQRGSNNVFARFMREDGSFLAGEVQVNPAVRLISTNYMMAYYGMRNNRMANRKMRVTDSFKALRLQNINPVVTGLPDGGAIVAYSGVRRVYTNYNRIAEQVTRSRGRYYTNDVPKRASSSQDFMQDVYFQRFGADGRKIGGEVVVNQWTKYNQRDPSIAALSDGSFVVVWVSEKSVYPFLSATNSGPGIFTASARVDILARRFDATGMPLDNEFTVNSDSRFSGQPSVAALPDGGFTVVWMQRGEILSDGWDIYGRSFDGAGAAAPSAARLNTYSYGDQFAPRIASLGAQQMVIWSSLGQDGSWEGVFGQMLMNGAASGGEFQINTTTVSKQIHPALASDGGNGFVVSWSGFDESSSFDLFAQNFLSTAAVGGLAAEQAGLERQAGVEPLRELLAGTSPLMASGAGVSGSGKRPLTVSITGSAAGAVVSWNTDPGGRYQVQRSVDLKTWRSLETPRMATTASDGVNLDLKGEGAFYRVLRLP